MKTTVLCFTLSAGLLCYGQSARSQEGGLPDTSGMGEVYGVNVFINVEQDFFWRRLNEDRNYTMGADLGANWKAKGVNRLHGRILKKTDFKGRYKTVSLGYGAFTPYDLASSQPVTDDRPYAGVLALRYTDLSYAPAQEFALYHSLAVGVLGTPIGREVQSFIHRQAIRNNSNNRVVPRGWHNQIGNGGEVTALLTAGVRELFTLIPGSSGAIEGVAEGLNVIGNLEANLGYYTNLTGGLTLTLGRVRQWYSFNPGSLSYVNEFAGTGESEKQPEFFFFIAARERAVFYNALLQGQFRDNPHELTPQQVKGFVLEYDAGFNIFFPCGLNLRAQLTSRSPEYAINFEYGRRHYWGGIFATYHF